jgi:hypothetical protein
LQPYSKATWQNPLHPLRKWEGIASIEEGTQTHRSRETEECGSRIETRTTRPSTQVKPRGRAHWYRARCGALPGADDPTEEG